MALTVIESSEPIKVESVIVHVFGDPGIGKSTLLNMTDGLLKLDFDRAEHRALGRQRIVQVDAWEDLAGLFQHPAFPAAKVIGADTLGRMVELAISSALKDPKAGNPATGPNQHGWTKVKGMFRSFLSELRAARKDFVLASHAKLERDDTGRKSAYPEVQGSAGPEVFKVCDAMAYMGMVGNDRVLDFNVSDLHLGKNPPGWKPFVVPSYAQSPHFLTEKILGPLKDYLNTLSEEQTAVLKAVSEIGAAVEALAATPEALTAFIATAEAVAHEAVKAQAKTLLWRRAKSLGFDFSRDAHAFVRPAPKVEAKPELPKCPHADALAASQKKPRTEVTCGCGVTFLGGHIQEPAA